MIYKNIKIKTPRSLIFIFGILALILLYFYNLENNIYFDLKAILGLIVLLYVSNMFLNRISRGDRYLFMIVSMILSIGLVMIYRINPELGLKQFLWAMIGITAFFISYYIMKFFPNWEKYSKFYIFIGYILFFLTFTLGKTVKGAKNWIQIMGIYFQPAEIIKLIIIFILASLYSKENNKRNKDSYIITLIIYSYLFLLFLQRDLGMALVFYSILVGIQFIYEENRRLLAYNLLIFILGGISGYLLFDHVKIRFQSWLNPWKYIENQGYQITQSLFAIAEGGFFGKGIGKGYPHLIPEVHTDFIFSAICEEMGILMGIGVIMLFLIFVYRGFKIAMVQQNKFYRVLAFGISLSFSVQIFIILGGVLKIIPLTGITLPFISYGGSSMLASFISLGVLQRASEKVGENN